MSEVIKVLGLDLSTATGTAVVSLKAGKPTFDHIGMVMAPKKVGGWDRVNCIAADVMQLVEAHKPDLVTIEGYGFGQMASIVTLAEIGSVIRFLLYQNQVPFIDVPPSSLKKFVAGKGNAKKEMMILNVFQKYGIQVSTNDEADAVGLAMFGLCAAGSKATQAQKETVAAVTKLHLPLARYLAELSFRCN
jgi:crossover junction endodeoxyribonuclease RuvC